MDKDKEIEYFNKMSEMLYSGIISDILDEMGIRNQVISPGTGIKPLNRDWVMVGRAKTLYNEPDINMDDPYDLAIVTMDKLENNQITVSGGETNYESIMGELSGHRMRLRGCRGCLINGYTRDAKQLIKMNFPVFCKGTTPIDTTGRVRVVDLDVPIPFGNKTISPGEIVFADFDGIIVIPKECEEEVIVKSLKRFEEESQVRQELREGKSMKDVWDKYHIM